MNNAISIIVCQFNPQRTKLVRTLNSIVAQKNVDFEIIIADDGSDNYDEMFYRDYFSSHSFCNYRFSRLIKNGGTVNNLLCALELAHGDYVYCISPGDLLYDETTLSDLLAFIKKKGSEIVFGDAVKYSIDQNTISL